MGRSTTKSNSGHGTSNDLPASRANPTKLGSDVLVHANKALNLQDASRTDKDGLKPDEPHEDATAPEAHAKDHADPEPPKVALCPNRAGRAHNVLAGPYVNVRVA